MRELETTGHVPAWVQEDDGTEPAEDRDEQGRAERAEELAGETCPECGAAPPHLPEECPAAEWYGGGGVGACEWAYVCSPDGRADLAGIEWGTEEWYAQVIAGTDLMHNVGACPVGEVGSDA
jgi:hypothetical protein